jgi:uncharacterized protein YjiS (DUF1127 family)
MTTCGMSVMTLFERFRLWRAAVQAERQVAAELAFYTDRELNEIGLCRGDVAGIAREAGRMARDKALHARPTSEAGHPWMARHA